VKWILILSLIFIGCSEKKFIYIDTNVNSDKKINKYIGVESIKLPLYMEDLEIMKNENNSLKETSVYLSKDLNNLVITFLSNELNDPYVFEYPFGVNKKPDILIKIFITDFFIQNNYIILNARVFINNRFKKISLKEKCDKNYGCISKVIKNLTLSISKEIQ